MKELRRGRRLTVGDDVVLVGIPEALGEAENLGRHGRACRAGRAEAAGHGGSLNQGFKGVRLVLLG